MVFQNTHYSDSSLRSYCFPNLLNRGVKDQDRDWIIRIWCFRTPIAANQNSTYSVFSNLISRGSNNHPEVSKPGQPWIERPR